MQDAFDGALPAGPDARLRDLDPIARHDLERHAGRVEALGTSVHRDFAGEGHGVAVELGAVAASDQLAALGLVVVGLLGRLDPELAHAHADQGIDRHGRSGRRLFARRGLVLPPEVERHALDQPHRLGRHADQPGSAPAGEQDGQAGLQPGGVERALGLRRVAAAVAGAHTGHASRHGRPAADHGAVLEHGFAPDLQVEAPARSVEVGGDQDAAGARQRARVEVADFPGDPAVPGLDAGGRFLDVEADRPQIAAAHDADIDRLRSAAVEREFGRAQAELEVGTARRRRQPVAETRTAAPHQVLDRDVQLVHAFRRLDQHPGVEGGGRRRQQPERVRVGDVVAGGGQVLAVRRRDGQHAEQVGGAERGGLNLDEKLLTGLDGDPVAVHFAGVVDSPVDDHGRVEDLVGGRLALEHLGVAAHDDREGQSSALRGAVPRRSDDVETARCGGGVGHRPCGGHGGTRGGGVARLARGRRGGGGPAVVRAGACRLAAGRDRAAGQLEPRLLSTPGAEREDRFGVVVVGGGDQLEAVEVPPLVAEAGVVNFDDVLPCLRRLPVEAGVDVDAGSLLVEGDLAAIAVEQPEHRIDRRTDAPRLDFQHDAFAGRRAEAIAVPFRAVERAVHDHRQFLDERRSGGASRGGPVCVGAAACVRSVCVAGALRGGPRCVAGAAAQIAFGDLGQGVHPEQQRVRETVLGDGAQRVEPRRGIAVDLHQEHRGLEVPIVGPPPLLQPVLVGGLAETGERAGQRAFDLHLARQAVALDHQPQRPALLAAVGVHVEEIRRRPRGADGRGDGDAGEP